MLPFDRAVSLCGYGGLAGSPFVMGLFVLVIRITLITRTNNPMTNGDPAKPP
jgi:hypothetical protein